MRCDAFDAHRPHPSALVFNQDRLQQIENGQVGLIDDQRVVLPLDRMECCPSPQ